MACIRSALLLIFLVILPGLSSGAEKIILNVILNEEKKGDYFFILEEEGRLLLAPDDFRTLGFRKLPAGVDDDDGDYIPLNSLSGVTTEVDEKNSVLRITADPMLLRKTSLDLSFRSTENIHYAAAPSAFLNYGLVYSTGDDSDLTSVAVPLEIGISKNRYLGLSTFSYLKTETDERFVRILSSITRDDPLHLRRIQVGDFPAYSGILGGSELLGGLSVSRNFTLQPFFRRSPGLDISGVVQTPSDVDLYANGTLIRQESLSPGQFEFLDLGRFSGAGEAMLIITDAFGQESRMSFPFYGSSLLLRPGLHEYSYNLGFKRRELGLESFNYSDPAFLAFHRVGLSRTFTGGLRAEADKDIVNAGPTATFLLKDLGEVDASFALSQEDGRFGYGFFANYYYSSRYFNSRLFLRGFSRDYSNLALSASDDKARLESSISLGFRRELLGSLSFSYAWADFHEDIDRDRISLFYSRRLFRTTSLNISASRIDAEERTYEAFASLTFLLGNRTSGSLGYAVQDDRSTETVTVQRNPPAGKGFGYRVIAENREDQNDKDLGGNAFVQYRGPIGIYSADYRRLGGESLYTFSLSGGVAHINRRTYLSRPLTDGFALVQVGNLEDVTVNYNNQEMGETGSGGAILVPGLISYTPNTISIDDQDIPVNYAIEEIKRIVSIPYRGGGIVQFDLNRLQAFTGRFFIKEKGEISPAEYWGLSFQHEGRPVETIVGKKGEFYLENLPPGDYRARLFMGEEECFFEMTIPESEEMFVDLGEITCEMD